MSKFTRIVMAVFGVMLATAVPAMAQDGGASGSFAFSEHIGVGLTVMGAGLGIGKLAASAYDGMSRQPELAGTIQTAMIIAAALIEGFTFFALYICMS